MIARTLALAVGLGAALAGSQLPEFAQQYRQRLGGAIDELAAVMQRFDADAGAAGLSRGEAIERLDRSSDDFTHRHGVSMAATAIRLERLEDQRQAMAEAGPFGRLLVFTRDLDPELATNTWRDFEPATPVTLESFVIGGAGFLAGYTLVRALAAPFRRRRTVRA